MHASEHKQPATRLPLLLCLSFFSQPPILIVQILFSSDMLFYS